MKKSIATLCTQVQATARALGIPMKRIQLEAVVADRARRRDDQVGEARQGDSVGGQVEHAPVSQDESMVLTTTSQTSHLEVTASSSHLEVRSSQLEVTGSSSHLDTTSPQPASHISTSQCLTNLLDCTCDQNAPASSVSQMANLLDVPDFTDSPPRMKEVQDAVQVILERDLVTLEEDINSLEKVLSQEVTVATANKHLKAETMSSSEQNQTANQLEETTLATEERLENRSAQFEDVSENTRRAHSNKRKNDQNEKSGESEPVEDDQIETRLKCEMCGNMSLKTQSALEIHVAGHLRADIAKTCGDLMRGLQCTLCGLEAKTRNQLVTHIGCKHGRVRFFCLKYFKDEYSTVMG